MFQNIHAPCKCQFVIFKKSFIIHLKSWKAIEYNVFFFLLLETKQQTARAIIGLVLEASWDRRSWSQAQKVTYWITGAVKTQLEA